MVTEVVVGISGDKGWADYNRKNGLKISRINRDWKDLEIWRH